MSTRWNSISDKFPRLVPHDAIEGGAKLRRSIRMNHRDESKFPLQMCLEVCAALTILGLWTVRTQFVKVAFNLS